MSGSIITGNDEGATFRTPAREGSRVSLHYPMLTNTNYSTWVIKMRVYLQAQGVWEAIQPGTDVETRMDKMALAAIYEAIPEEILLLIAEKETAKEAWETLKTKYVGADRVKQAKLQTLKSEFETLRMKEAETIDDFAGRLTAIVSKSAGLGGKIEESTVVKKFLVAIPNKFLPIVTSIEQFADLTTMTLEEAIGRLKTFEERIRGAGGEEDEHLLLTRAEWKAKEEGENSPNSSKGRGASSGHNRGRGCGRGYGRGCSEGGRGNESNHCERKFDKTKVRCYNCQNYGHFASECHFASESRSKKENERAHLVEAQGDDDEPALLATEGVLL